MLDDDGYLTLVDRIRDMIIGGGGEPVPQGDRERARTALRGARSSGRRPSRRRVYGEVPVAYVVAVYPDATVGEELLDHLSSRLTRSKLPVSVTVVDDLPCNPVGKIDKPTLQSGPVPWPIPPKPTRRTRPTRKGAPTMGFKEGVPDVDLATFMDRPYLERIKVTSRFWAEDGFGTPKMLPLIYIVKVLVLYIGIGVTIATLTSGFGVFDVGTWWDQPIIYQKLVLWTVLLETLGLAGSWGPLAGHCAHDKRFALVASGDHPAPTMAGQGALHPR